MRPATSRWSTVVAAAVVALPASVAPTQSVEHVTHARVAVSGLVLTDHPPAAQESASTEPTLEATKAWLESDGQRLMRNSGKTRFTRRGVANLISHTAKDVRLEGCVLSFVEDTETTTRSGEGDSTTRSSSVVRIPLKDLDTGEIVPALDRLWTRHFPGLKIHAVHVATRASVGATIMIETGNVQRTWRDARIPVRNLEDGELVARAVRRGARLCGAPTS
jgi:hypothetical protein